MKEQQLKRLLAIAVVAGFLGIGLVGCGGGKDSSTSVALRPPKVQTQSVETEGQGGGANTSNNGGGEKPAGGGGPGTIKGKIVVAEADAGSIPPPEIVMFAKGKAPVDTNFCAAETPIYDESLIINPMNRGVQNVFVYLEEMPKGGKKQIASQSAWPTGEGEGALVLDQQNCTYKPHAMILVAGQEFTANSQDSVVHSYKGTPVKNRDFNLTIPSKGTLKVKPFTRSEKYPVPISCATHNWMSGYQLPLDHPYAAVTNPDGEFTISDIPPGDHKFIIWHENKGVLAERDITVEPGDNTETITFRLNQLKK